MEWDGGGTAIPHGHRVGCPRSRRHEDPGTDPSTVCKGEIPRGCADTHEEENKKNPKSKNPPMPIIRMSLQIPPMMSQGCFCKVDDLGRLRIRDDFSQNVAGILQVSPANINSRQICP
ncbi:MAG TPA: hypothetical protein DET40_02065 [Lentisphaeria bacterium]|nr:MAG: hypothetical protein A2X45_10175 [Lentisphaerae bacterium GWF2_50_93]HCE42318.1 hypothetical protein [Lentisphaeria bacterium]